MTFANQGSVTKTGKFSRSQAASKRFLPKPNVAGSSYEPGYRHTSSPRSVNVVFASTMAMIYRLITAYLSGIRANIWVSPLTLEL